MPRPTSMYCIFRRSVKLRKRLFGKSTLVYTIRIYIFVCRIYKVDSHLLNIHFIESLRTTNREFYFYIISYSYIHNHLYKQQRASLRLPNIVKLLVRTVNIVIYRRSGKFRKLCNEIRHLASLIVNFKSLLSLTNEIVSSIILVLKLKSKTIILL